MPNEENVVGSKDWADRINKLMSGTLHDQIRGLAEAVRDGFERITPETQQAWTLERLEALSASVASLSTGLEVLAAAVGDRLEVLTGSLGTQAEVMRSRLAPMMDEQIAALEERLADLLRQRPAASPVTPEIAAVRDEVLAAREGIDEAVADAQSQLAEQVRRGLQSVNDAVKSHLEAAAEREIDRVAEMSRQHEALVEQVSKFSHALMDAVGGLRGDLAGLPAVLTERLDRLGQGAGDALASTLEQGIARIRDGATEALGSHLDEAASLLAERAAAIEQSLTGRLEELRASLHDAVGTLGESVGAAVREETGPIRPAFEEVRDSLAASGERIDAVMEFLRKLRGDIGGAMEDLGTAVEALPEDVAKRVDANRMAIGEELESIRSALASDLGSVRNSLAVAVTAAKDEIGASAAAGVEERLGASIARLEEGLKGLGADMEFLAQRAGGGGAGASPELRGELARVQESINTTTKRLEDRLEALRRLMLRTVSASESP